MFRTGGDFAPEHVYALHGQLARWAPGVETVCLTNTRLEGVRTEPMLHSFPGWWSKLKLFRPHFEGDIFYLDLDSVIVGPIGSLLAQKHTTLLSDFYRPGRPASGVMFLPEGSRGRVWDAWMVNPKQFMLGKHGDQGFLGKVLADPKRWQSVAPGAIVSYKADVRPNGDQVPESARIVAFHGKPRPWGLPKDHPLYKAAGY